ncbi:unnamed protein product [Pleuronectes platessa]|uniref:Uncharacterized protein n=1 Tax=Pleuronectes platessa TaxID=8262 RepID=A0A9N7ULP9_PLEPL|nr:unnamed protein product [Pleuronectes platessa]
MANVTSHPRIYQSVRANVCTFIVKTPKSEHALRARMERTLEAVDPPDTALTSCLCALHVRCNGPSVAPERSCRRKNPPVRARILRFNNKRFTGLPENLRATRKQHRGGHSWLWQGAWLALDATDETHLQSISTHHPPRKGLVFPPLQCRIIPYSMVSCALQKLSTLLPLDTT